MATTVARLEAILSAQTRDFDRAMNRSESRLKSVGKTAAFVAGGAALGAIGYTLKTGIKEWSEQTKVAAQTNAVLKSTGHAANVTLKHVDRLAASVSSYSGMDDEAVQSGENLLLTFTQIQNRVGKTNDIFDQATRLTADLAQAMGMDMSRAALQVGKALNDPARGYARLQRIGVAFTKGQIASIKAMQEAGNTAGAQKVILAELRKEFGGSAKAYGETLPGQIAIARESFNNFAGMLVGKMIPVLERTIGWLRDHWPEISAAIGRFWASVKPTLSAFGQIIAEVAGLFQKHWGTIGPILEKLARIVETQIKIIAAPLKIIAALLRGDWSEAWKAFKDGVVEQLSLLWQEIDLFIGPVIDKFSDLPGDIKDAFVSAWSSSVGEITDKFSNVKDFVSDRADDVVDFFKKLPGRILSAFTGAWSGVLGTIHEKFINLKNWIGDRVSDVVGFYAGLPGRLSSAFIGAWANIIEGVHEKFSNLKDWIRDNIVDKIVGFFADMPDRLGKVVEPIKKVWQKIQAATASLRTEFGTLWSVFSKIVGAFRWLLDKAKDIIGFFSKLGGAVGDSSGRMKGTGDAIGSVGRGAPPGQSGAGAGKRFNVGRQLWDEIGMGNRLGLIVTSGYRKGAVTKHGTPSDHGYFPSRAVDMAGPSNAMAQMFNWLVGRKEIKQAFYDPMGSIFNGIRSSYREGGHSDHIHIAEYDKGGYLRPGWNLAYNGLGRPEPVGGGDVIIPVSIGGEQIATVVFDMLRRKAKVFENRNGRPAFGGA